MSDEFGDVDMLAWSTTRLADLERQIARLTAEAQAVRQIKAGAEALAAIEGGEAPTPAHAAVATPAADSPATGGEIDHRPRGKEAVRLILKDHTVPMNAAQVAKVAVERGWIDDSPRVEDAIRTNLGRAEASYDDVVKAGRGLYRFERQEFAADDFDASKYLDSIQGSLQGDAVSNT